MKKTYVVAQRTKFDGKPVEVGDVVECEEGFGQYLVQHGKLAEQVDAPAEPKRRTRKASDD